MDSTAFGVDSVNNIDIEIDLQDSPGLDELEANYSQLFPSSDHPAATGIEANEDVLVEPQVILPNLIRMPGRVMAGRELKEQERRSAYEVLLRKSADGVLKRRMKTDVARTYHVGPRTIQRIWKRATDSPDNDYKSRRKNCGRTKMEFDLNRMRDIDLRNRTTLESLAYALGVSKTYLHGKVKDGTIRRHTNAIKPVLTPANHVMRIRHCLSSLDPSTLPHDPKFKHMYNNVHIDEKWFYLTKRHETYYLMADEVDPIRTSKSSKFIGKVMFLAAVERPRYDSDGNCTFDGKIGIFPMVKYVAAVRKSRNRPRGTMELKPLPVIDRPVIRSFLIDKVLPVIASVWPLDSFTEQIFIQQDNCATHIRVDDKFFLEAVEELGMNISLFCQPPNSPDLNILDLGFFRAIQSLQTKECAKNLEELCSAVTRAYDVYPTNMCNLMFITLQSCMLEVLKSGGSNRYKIPHMKKNALEGEGELPLTLACPVDLYSALSSEYGR